MSKRKSSTRKSRSPRVRTPVGDLAAAGQAMIIEAQDRASGAMQQVTRMASDAANTLEKRRDIELKNLRDLLKDVNKTLGGLEKRYRTLEQRLTKQIETLSGRTVKASDLDKRIRAVEAEIRKATGLGTKKAASSPKRSAAQRKARTSTVRRASTAAGKTAGTARKAASTTTRRASSAARSAGTAVSTAAKAASTGAKAGATSARRSAAGSAGGRKTAAKRSTARKRSTAKKSTAAKPASSRNGTGTSSS